MQSASVVQAVNPAASVPVVHVPATVSHVPVVTLVQVSKLGLPQVERATQRVTFPLHRVGIPSAFTVCATQLTHFPWLVALARHEASES